ncbi:hypothetical protein QAD02_007734 [Eretmocerus hayati]|uniref:Uncharacterized protein n=1 Tax=Eretmocerus hayati TaxID=131215 RepID=A0ACC2N6X6_9HYME|nr:hypothetical protein QAD02_007734 [Eretmocerus hayati]
MVPVGAAGRTEAGTVLCVVSSYVIVFVLLHLDFGPVSIESRDLAKGERDLDLDLGDDDLELELEISSLLDSETTKTTKSFRHRDTMYGAFLRPHRRKILQQL